MLAAAGAAATLYGSTIHIRSSVADLLPDDLPALVRLRHVEASLGSTELLEIAVVAEDHAAGERAADAVAAALRSWPEIRWATARRDVGYFLDHRLYYLPREALEKLADRLEARIAYERCVAGLAPCLDLVPGPDGKLPPPPPLRVDDLVPADLASVVPPSLRFLADALRTTSSTGAPAGTGVGAASAPATAGAKAPPPPPDAPPRDAPLVTPDGRIHVVMALPVSPAQDLAFTEALLEKVDQLGAAQGPAVQVIAMGAYPFNLEEYHSVRGDGILTGVVALVLVLTTIVSYFRRWRALWVIGVPLVVSAGSTLAVARALVGDLNVITTFVIAILPGLTIDNFGVHLYGRFSRARDGGLGLPEALERTWRETWLPLVVATVTSAAALLTLLAFRFPGFSELGLIAGVSLFAAFAATVLLFPALCAAAERVVPWRRRGAPAQPVPTAGATVTDPTPVAAPSPSPRARRVAFACLALGALLAAGGGVAWARHQFEYDFAKLQRVHDASRTKAAAGYRAAMPVAPTGFPIAVLGETAADLVRALPVLEASVGPATPFRAFVSVHSFLPRDVEGKRPALDRIAAAVARAERFADDDLAAAAEELRTLASAPPPRPAELPAWVTDLFRTKDGSIERLALLYTDVPANDARAMRALQAELDRLSAAHPGVGFVSGNTMIGEAVRMVQEDGARAFVIALVVVFGLVLATTRSLRTSALCMVPLVAGLLWLGGVMDLFGIRLGMFNVVVLPMLLGMSIDGAVYLVDEATRAASLRALLRHTGADVGVSTVTTLIGFVCLLLARHRGLSSIGWLALAGMLSVLASTLLFLPLVLYVLPARRRPDAPRA
ncbi:MAG TPA: MMPL family transporter [Myxococcota bacterium]|nr:MMPL family transporter [Myxococcota bacterium]